MTRGCSIMTGLLAGLRCRSCRLVVMVAPLQPDPEDEQRWAEHEQRCHEASEPGCGGHHRSRGLGAGSRTGAAESSPRRLRRCQSTGTTSRAVSRPGLRRASGHQSHPGNHHRRCHHRSASPMKSPSAYPAAGRILSSGSTHQATSTSATSGCGTWQPSVAGAHHGHRRSARTRRPGWPGGQGNRPCAPPRCRHRGWAGRPSERRRPFAGRP